MTVHPRVGLHQVAFLDETTSSFIEHCRKIGVEHATLVTPVLMRPGAVAEAQRAPLNALPDKPGFGAAAG